MLPNRDCTVDETLHGFSMLADSPPDPCRGMMSTDRRRFLQLLGASSLAAAFPPSISRALSIPARRRTGTIEDVEHIVILMQENRSFDHYFGSLRGVRGFSDPRAVRLPSGAPVWNQPNGDGVITPFHPTAANLGLQFIEDLPHNWADTQKAWNNGKYDQWIPNKGTTTMAYLTRADIPYHYALADAFTICDAYHCSFLGSTDPNRYHMWTGWVGNDGKGGGPVLNNAEAGYDWHTFPERLQDEGISWKIYQDVGEGLDADHAWGWGLPYIGNYGDNSLLYFHQYQNAPADSPLARFARTGTNITAGGTLFDALKKDVSAGTLPQVSWITAPEAYTEHPNWPANYGAWYVSQVLDALTSNPDVWSKTVFFLNYDENDGFFDHVVPPTPPVNRAQGLSTVETTYEVFPGDPAFVSGPIGLGVRVPLLAISPWSKGGWVSSEVFDHTSLIQFIERRFARQHPKLIETNITKWRRAVVGDLTRLFDFDQPDNKQVKLPSTTGYVPPDNQTHTDYKPLPPSSHALPKQEPGVRPARPVPYELQADGTVDVSARTLKVQFKNSGDLAAVFQVRSADPSSGPWTYTVGPRASLRDSWAFPKTGDGAYDFAVYGPNGFLRTYKGNVSTRQRANLVVRVDYRGQRAGIVLELANTGNSALKVSIVDTYKNEQTARSLQGGDDTTVQWPLDDSYGWYDLTVKVDQDASFERRIAGHVESGKASMTDPLLGK
jgi:phospholipase C